jgi:dihydropteroate synthase/2-amino-4-hydroxy-6-hydroxymethyldihydropteridine diphosphokinase
MSAPKTFVALGLGSNLGDRHGSLIAALDRLSTRIELESIASIYETEPWGYADQPKFLNTACVGTTALTPDEVLAFVKSIEVEMGRETTFRYGPRTIDIDVLLYDDQMIERADYHVPHAQLIERAFVLQPLAEIAPQVVHPKLHRTIAELRDQVDAAGVKLFARRPLRVGSRWLHWDRQTYVMGILNVTPDSFSGDGLLQGQNWIDAAIDQARSMLQAGAHIIDVGGESTRPGSQPISIAAEIDRVLPVIEALAAQQIGPISIDTYKAEVAHRCLEAGAALINEVWGLRRDADMAAVAAQHAAPIVLMHNRSKVEDAARSAQAKLGGRYVSSQYDDLIGDISRELRESIGLAQAAGIPDHRIIIDPGIGFGKTTDQNLELINRLNEFKVLGFPILSGPSRKSFIGYTLDVPPDQRGWGTAAAVAISIARGADMVRVHDVAQMSQVAKMTDAMVRRKM